MVDELPSAAPSPASAAVCPWCSAALPSVDAESCPSCGARLVGEENVEIPGVTSVYPDLLAAASSPRRVKRTFGALFVGDDDEIPPPSEAEMPALARPDAEVRREMLRLELEARLHDLQAEARSLDAEEGIVSQVGEATPAGPVAPEPPEGDDQ